MYKLHDKVAQNLLLLYRGFPQAQWKLFIVQQRSLLPDAMKSPAPPTSLTACLQNIQTDTASLDSQTPINLALRTQTSPAARSLSPFALVFGSHAISGNTSANKQSVKYYKTCFIFRIC